MAYVSGGGVEQLGRFGIDQATQLSKGGHTSLGGSRRRDLDGTRVRRVRPRKIGRCVDLWNYRC